MKNAILLFSALLLSGCAAQQAQISNTNQPAANNAAAANPHSPASNPGGIQSSHSNSQQSKPAPDTGAGAGNPPMMTGNSRAIDTGKLDEAIAKAEKDLKAKPNDDAAKKVLADAWAARGFALTEAAQYRAALGDFRKCLKLDATNEEARAMHDQIISIFQSLSREPPKEGEEPPPLPFSKS